MKSENETKIFKNIKANGDRIEYISECGTKIDPFVSCALRWDEAGKFNDKTVEVERRLALAAYARRVNRLGRF